MSDDNGKIHPVILCGGSGTRLWPLSRKDRPKPFRNLLGDRTLFQQTLDRVAEGDIFAAPTVVAGEDHVDVIAGQLENRTASLIVEPSAKNTAPAIALAALRLPRDAVMLICPSDQAIANRAAFLEGVGKGAELARDGKIVAFGITPTRPETGYGYIQVGKPCGSGHLVSRFVEKPDDARAQQFLQTGGFVWNGGIFLFRAGSLLAELEKHRPAMAEFVREAVAKGTDSDSNRFYPASDPFGNIEAESIDFAVMENTDRAAVVAADMGWSDIGDWDALFTARQTAGLSEGAMLDTVDATNVRAMSDGPRVSVVGLSDIVVVVDGNEVLVTSRGAAQKVGRLPGAKRQ